MQLSAARSRNRRPKQKVSGESVQREQTEEHEAPLAAGNAPLPAESQPEAHGADGREEAPTSRHISREVAFQILRDYLIQTGDQSLWEDASTAAIRHIRYDLGTRCDVIAFHFGLGPRSIYRKLEPDVERTRHPLESMLSLCEKKPRSLPYLFSKLREARPFNCDFSQWLELLVKLGHIEKDREGRYHRKVQTVPLDSI